MVVIDPEGTASAFEVAVSPPRRDAYICTKVLPPRLPSGLVTRPRLLSVLEASLTRKLTLLEAPAGFGKTTLLCEWRKRLLDGALAAVAWITLDGDDEDPKQLYAYIAEAMRRSTNGRLGRTHDVLAVDPAIPPRSLLSVLINEIAESAAPFVLVLDDYELVGSQTLHDAVRSLIAYAPENMHVCVASRVRVPFRLSQMRAAGELIEIGESALRFRSDETRAFLTRAQTTPSRFWDADALCAASEGWIAGLQIASLPRERGTALDVRFSAQRETWQYLRENVLDFAPPPVLDFLLQTSILGQLSPDLCAAVTGMDACEAMLADLHARNLFILPLDETNTWFRYHNSFSEFLQAELSKRSSSGTVVALHRRAGLWLASKRQWAQAVGHAMAAGDAAQAAEWTEHCAMELVESGDLHTLALWSKRMPADSLRVRVRLRFAFAWAFALLFRFADVESALDALECDDASGAVALCVADRLELRAIRALATALADNDSVGAVRLATECLADMPHGDSWMHRIMRNVATWGHTHEHAYAAARAVQLELVDGGDWDSKLFAPTCRNGLLGMGWAQQGALGRAAASYDEVARFAERAGRYSAAAAYLACFAAEIAYEAGDVEGALDTLVGRWNTIDETCSLDAVLRAYRTAARVEIARGGRAAAAQLLERGIAIGERRAWKRLVTGLGSERVRLALLCGHLAEARGWQRTIELVSDAVPADSRGTLACARDDVTVSRARLAIHAKKFDAAIALLRPLADGYAAYGATLLFVRTQALLAAALSRAQRHADADATLEIALRAAGNEWLVRGFLDEGPDIREALARAVSRLAPAPANAGNAESSHWGRAFEGAFPVNSARESRALPEPSEVAPLLAALSERERQILGHLAEGKQNKQIASLLYVSPETVKWHLKRIYDKLSVRSRTEAARLVVICGRA
jgi:LuxR family maltose regulon positive regulatory protein